MWLRLLTFSSAVLLLKTLFQFTNKIGRCIIPDLCFYNPKLPIAEEEKGRGRGMLRLIHPYIIS